MEKAASETLPLATRPSAPHQRHWRVSESTVSLFRFLTASWLAIALLWYYRPEGGYFDYENKGFEAAIASGCQQVDPLFPKNEASDLKDIDKYFSSTAFRNESIHRLSGIVQIPSVSFDDMGEVGEDDRFDIFYKVEEYLEQTYPLVHKHLQKETINTHGLLYTWKGSDESLKPSLLMAHQDVVPVEPTTVDDWTHPPFSGFYDGKYIWGRGSQDTKTQVIAIFSSVEALLAADFKPTRTLLLSFGFDEEISGTRGAGSLAPFLQERYGKDSIAALIDEGNAFAERWGDVYALPGVGEKGYTDVHVTVRMPGGHSSVPSPHTSIGVISELITLVERDPYKPWLADENPYLGLMQCGAKYSDSFPKKLRKLLSKRKSKSASDNPNLDTCPASTKHDDALAEAAAADNAFTRYLMQTSQAVDLISGGAKVNALPERVEAVINHRINFGETPEQAQDRVARKAARIAKRHGLKLYAYPADGEKVGGNSIALSAAKTTLDVAPATPLDVHVPGTKDLSPWGVLSGTTRAVFGERIKMAPGSMTGNTDTRYYWDLTKHIFRFAPGFDPEEDQSGNGNIHTVNEHMSVQGHVNSVKFFTTWIRNVDEAKFE